jgi:hypothetical protein
MTNEEILRQATLLRNASTDARELIELLDLDVGAGQAAFRSATPEARGLIRRWLDPEFQSTERTRQLDPHLGTRLSKSCGRKFVPVYSWTEVAAELRRLAERIPPGQTLELMVFGGTALQHWGMEGRLTRDIDVQLSKSSANLQGLMPALTPAVQFRDQPRPTRPYVEVMRPQDDFTLPDFSTAETIEIAKPQVAVSRAG